MPSRWIAACSLAALVGCGSSTPPGAAPPTSPPVVVPTVAPAATGTSVPVEAPPSKAVAYAPVACEKALEVGAVDQKRPLATPANVAGKTLMSPNFGGQTGFYAVTGSVPPPRQAVTSPLAIELDGPRQLRPTDPVALKLTFHNHGKAALGVMRPLDASFERWRFPTYDLYALDLKTNVAYRYAFVGGRCGNVNAVSLEDYVELSPGATRTDVHANGWATHLKDARLLAPGRYRLWVVYSFCTSRRCVGSPFGASPCGS